MLSTKKERVLHGASESQTWFFKHNRERKPDGNNRDIIEFKVEFMCFFEKLDQALQDVLSYLIKEHLPMALC